MKAKIFICAILLGLTSCSSTKSVSTNDGSSIENAIKVKDVGEEYAVVRRLCTDCKVKSQSLVSNSKGNKYYDVLTVEKPNGEEVNYYFDINSFYGKW